MNNATPFIQSVRNVAAILKRLLALIWTVITKLLLILLFTIKSAFVQLAVKSETASEFPPKSGLYPRHPLLFSLYAGRNTSIINLVLE